MVPKKKILKCVFYHKWAWKPSGHVTNVIITYFHFLVPISLHIKFGQKRSSGFSEKQDLILICK